MLRVNNFQGHSLNLSEVMRIAPEVEAKYGRTRIQAGDVLLTIVGSVGQVAVVPDELSGWNIARAIAMIRPNKPELSRWISLVLRSPQAQYQLGVTANTTVQTTINLKDLRELRIPLPDEDERGAIAHILGTLDDKIELNRRRNQTLEAMARALFQDWFVDFGPVRAKMEGREPYLPDDLWRLFPERLDEAGKPEGWEMVPASELIEFNPSEPLRKGTSAPYLDMASLPTIGSSSRPPITREFGSGMRFCNGDTLMARITPCLENGKTAFVQCLPDGAVGWGSTEFIVMRSRRPVPAEYTYLLARDSTFREHAIRSMTGTSGRQRAQADSVATFKLVSPPQDAIWHAFSKLVAPMFESIKVNAAESDALAQLRNTLLPKLISGELRVADAEKFVEHVGP